MTRHSETASSAMGHVSPQRLARYVGVAWLATIVIGIGGSILITQGIDINLSADVEATAQNMLNAELRLRAKAYLALLMFVLEVFVSLGLLLLLEKYNRLLSGLSAIVGISASIVIALGAMFSLNAAELASNEAFIALGSGADRLLLTGLQATSEYTSFHLALILGSLAKAGFYRVLLQSRLIPPLISAWGLFASVLVAFMIVARDFIPALGAQALTVSFMLANLIAMVSTGLYFCIKGVRHTTG